MKKICIVTTVSLTLKSFVVETAKHLYNHEGYDITLICDNDPDFAASLPEYLHYIPVKMARGIDFSALRSIKSLYKIFKTEKFDLVQYSTPNASCYASIAAFFARVPIRLYNQWGIRYVGLGGFSRKVFKAIEKMVCRLSTHARAVSHLNMQFAISEGLYKPQKVAVIGNGGTIGVDLDEFSMDSKSDWRNEVRTAHSLSDNDFVYGFVGRISADKGCGELLSAFKAVSEKHQNAKLLVVGSMEENCGVDPKLISWAQGCPSVIFTGSLPHDRVKNYYSAIDVLVHPTYREGFGMVIQEAGALAVPTITTNIPGASEVMEKDISCLIVEPRDAASLEKAMLNLIESPEKAVALGKAALKRTRTLYERSIMLEFQRQNYKELLS